MAAAPSDRVLITDFDGTLTEIDFYERVLAHVPADTMPDYWGRYVAGELTHFDALAGMFTHLPGDENSLMAIAREQRFDPAIPAAVARLEQAGWQVWVVSAGCQWYIDRLLAEHGLRLPVYANPGRLVPGGGLEMLRPTDSPYYSPSTGIDKRALVADAVRRFGEVAFAGDGRPDREAIVLVPAERRFARGWLAERLLRQGEQFRPFARWPEIADALVAASG